MGNIRLRTFPVHKAATLLPDHSRHLATQENLQQADRKQGSTLPLVASRCVPLPSGAGGRHLASWVRAELTDEQTAIDRKVFAGLYRAAGGQLLLIMADNAGAALGPAVCRHYPSQQDFLWLESEPSESEPSESDKSELEKAEPARDARAKAWPAGTPAPARWHWCLVRSGVPVAEGLESSAEQIEQMLAVQKGVITVIHAEIHAREWLQTLSQEVELHWLRLEHRARQALDRQTRLLPMLQLYRRLLLLQWLRASALVAVLVCGGGLVVVLLGNWHQEIEPQTQLTTALAVARVVLLPTPEIPAAASLMATYQQLIAFWAAGATAIEVRLEPQRLRISVGLPGEHRTEAAIAVRRVAKRNGLSLETSSQHSLNFSGKPGAFAASGAMQTAGWTPSAAGMHANKSPANVGLLPSSDGKHSSLKTTESSPAMLPLLAETLTDANLAEMHLNASGDWKLKSLSLSVQSDTPRSNTSLPVAIEEAQQ